jgi:rhodanese-related sulfurtransferase
MLPKKRDNNYFYMSNEVPDLISRRMFTFGGLAAGTVAAAGGTTSFSEEAKAATLKGWSPIINENWASFWNRARAKEVLVIDARHEGNGERDDKIPAGIKTLSVQQDEAMGISDEELATIKAHKGQIAIFCKGGVRSVQLAEYLKENNINNQVFSLEGGLDSDPNKIEDKSKQVENGDEEVTRVAARN